jgi:5'-methylthioadenosine phosphorylase
MIGIMGGSGLYEIEGLSVKESRDVDTPFGRPSGPVSKCEYEGRTLCFLPRHGGDHSIPPHKVNYRANVWALKDTGVQKIISVSAVGGINTNFEPGGIVLGSQILDFTKNRISTFFDENDVVHVDCTYPYCGDMKNIIVTVAKDTGIDIVDGSTYVAVEGPRLETAAEIEFYRSAGADIVGMTAMPEASLAREAEMCYSGIYVVTNYAAGIKGDKLTTDEVVQTMNASADRVKVLLSKVLTSLDRNGMCECRNALKNARM